MASTRTRATGKTTFLRFAVDLAKFFAVSPPYRIPKDQLSASVRERAACVVGLGDAQRLNLHLGDRITLLGDIFPVTLALVRGIYENPLDDGGLLFNYEYLRESMAQPGRHVYGEAESPEAVPRVIDASGNITNLRWFRQRRQGS
jgi:putative ABC transport system permease protein